MTIWKYTLEPADSQRISMPVDSEVLCCQEQYGCICMWAAIDDSHDGEVEDRTFHIIGTGHSIPDVKHLKYRGTVQMVEGTLVWHIFEEGKD
jgi:hypothetical protein